MREKKLSVRLGDKLHAEIKKKASKYNQSISEYVRNLLIKNIEKEENKMKNQFKYDIPVRLECGCETVWHEGEQLYVGAYAWCENCQDDTRVAAILDKTFQEEIETEK